MSHNCCEYCKNKLCFKDLKEIKDKEKTIEVPKVVTLNNDWQITELEIKKVNKINENGFYYTELYDLVLFNKENPGYVTLEDNFIVLKTNGNKTIGKIANEDLFFYLYSTGEKLSCTSFSDTFKTKSRLENKNIYAIYLKMN